MKRLPAMIDSLWSRAEAAVRHGKWGDARSCSIGCIWNFLREISASRPGALSIWARPISPSSRQLEAAREFRRASDETPNDPIAPEALLRLGDVYADLWRRPELDPTYGQTALATYQELLNRYPGSSAAKRGATPDRGAERAVCLQGITRPAMYYFRLKAYDSAILYLKDLVATYPKAAVVPEALVKLVQAYKTLGIPRGRAGDLRLHSPIPSPGTRSRRSLSLRTRGA